MFPFHFQIEPDDGLPQKICTECTNLVNSALYLRNISHLSLKKLEEFKNNLQNEESPSIVNDLAKNVLVKNDNDEDNSGFPELEIEIEFDRLTERDDGGLETEKVDEPKEEQVIEKDDSRGESTVDEDKDVTATRSMFNKDKIDKGRHLAKSDGIFFPSQCCQRRQYTSIY